MSYILDALKRADSERERGSIPGLHAQPAPVVAADARSHRRLKPWLWLVLVLPAVLLALLAWRMMARETAQDLARPVAAAPVLSPPAAAQQAARATPAPAAPS
ncbi:MAG: general secretion pathway protein GspB, partial [Burkholderiaceae bacterium]